MRPVVAMLPMEAAPGWTATLDGEPWPVFSGAGDMVGTRLPVGAHRLVFTWQMPAFDRVTLWCTLAGLLGVSKSSRSS